MYSPLACHFGESCQVLYCRHCPRCSLFWILCVSGMKPYFPRYLTTLDACLEGQPWPTPGSNCKYCNSTWTLVSTTQPLLKSTIFQNVLSFNLFILTYNQSCLIILMKSCRQKHSSERIWRRNVNQNIAYNSP